MDNQRLGLTVYLLKPGDLPKLEAKLVRTTSAALPLAPPLVGFFLPLPSDSEEPRWATAVKSAIQATNAPGLSAQSPSGLMAVTRGPNTFVITFGHGWQKLEDEWLQSDFGRRVALNAIPRDQLVEVRAEQVFARWHIADERAPLASSIDDFGVEFDRDLVAVVEGVPSKTLRDLLGAKIRGGTSFKVVVPFNTFPEILDKAAELFKDDGYKKIWPEIDNVTPIGDQTEIEQLEAQFDADFASGKAQRHIIMFAPSRRDEGNQSIESYVFGRMSKLAPVNRVLTITGWTSMLHLNGKVPTVAEAKNTRIHLLDEEKEEIRAYRVFDCFGYEMALGGKHYVLSAGVWYEVVGKFLHRINKTAGAISPPKTNLIPWAPPESEGDYNERCAKAKGFLLFDAKNIHYGGGQSKFEFCDFLDPKTKTLFFAKITTRSSG